MIYAKLCFRECKYTLSHFSWLLHATEEERGSLLPIEVRALARMGGARKSDVRMEI
jgi:hypothetical protein